MPGATGGASGQELEPSDQARLGVIRQRLEEASEALAECERGAKAGRPEWLEAVVPAWSAVDELQRLMWASVEVWRERASAGGRDELVQRCDELRIRRVAEPSLHERALIEVADELEVVARIAGWQFDRRPFESAIEQLNGDAVGELA